MQVDIQCGEPERIKLGELNLIDEEVVRTRSYYFNCVVRV